VKDALTNGNLVKVITQELVQIVKVLIGINQEKIKMNKETQIAKSNIKRKKEVFEGCGDKTSTGGTCGNTSKTNELVIYDEGTNKEKFESTKLKRFCEECWKDIFQLKGEILSHKRACERFLKFLKKVNGFENEKDNLINDLTNSIKIYEKENIK